MTSEIISYAVIMHPSEYIFLPKADIYLNRGLPISLRGGLTAYRYGSPMNIIVYLYIFFKYILYIYSIIIKKPLSNILVTVRKRFLLS